MLLSYIHRTGQEPYPDLCVLADKTDVYSVPVSVDSLPATDSSVIRLGPHEAITVKPGEEASEKILAPVNPSLLYLTPSQPDMPGVVVAKVKVKKVDEHSYLVFFQQEKDIQSGEWRPWEPNKTR